MLEKITIKNFKSIYNDTIDLGRVNVFIGENGCGKSNILEAVAFAGALKNNKTVDSEILFSKGVRIAKPDLMRSSFLGKKQGEIEIEITTNNTTFKCLPIAKDKEDINTIWEDKDENIQIILDNKIVGKTLLDFFETEEGKSLIKKINIDKNIKDASEKLGNEIVEKALKTKIGNLTVAYISIEDFVLYTLNTPALRGFTNESRKEPVGINGENLDVLIANFTKEELLELKKYSYFIDWLDDFVVDEHDQMKLKGYKLNRSKSRLYFTDKFMARKNNLFSAENANEGILHVLFYLSVMISHRTPKFFAIDNIESALNPHLCRYLMTEICNLAKLKDKQLLITTHNPAILDGLDLFDDEIRLFEVYRNEQGHTTTRRITLKPNPDTNKYKLSELWTRGFLGAISQNF